MSREVPPPLPIAAMRVEAGTSQASGGLIRSPPTRMLLTGPLTTLRQNGEWYSLALTRDVHTFAPQSGVLMAQCTRANGRFPAKLPPQAPGGRRGASATELRAGLPVAIQDPQPRRRLLLAECLWTCTGCVQACVRRYIARRGTAQHGMVCSATQHHDATL